MGFAQREKTGRGNRMPMEAGGGPFLGGRMKIRRSFFPGAKALAENGKLRQWKEWTGQPKTPNAVAERKERELTGKESLEEKGGDREKKDEGGKKKKRHYDQVKIILRKGKSKSADRRRSGARLRELYNKEWGRFQKGTEPGNRQWRVKNAAKQSAHLQGGEKRVTRPRGKLPVEIRGRKGG